MSDGRIDQETSAITVSTDRAVARLRRLSRSVAEVTLSGYGEAPLVPLTVEHLRAWRFDAVRMTLFVDASELAAYSPEFRREWTLWLLNAVADLAVVYVLGDARALFTGVPASGVVLSDLVRRVRDRADYEAKKQEAIWDN
jgi:hypothetical protein